MVRLQRSMWIPRVSPRWISAITPMALFGQWKELLLLTAGYWERWDILSESAIRLPKISPEIKIRGFLLPAWHILVEFAEMTVNIKKKFIELCTSLLYNEKISRILNKDGVLWTVG